MTGAPIRRRRWASGWGMVLLGGACGCGSARAAGQQTPPGLEEIVVTATRRELALSDAPLAVSVLSERDLEETGVRAFRDYLGFIPGAAFSDVGFADAKITVRGISTDIFSEVRDLTAVYLDEVPITNPGTHLIVQSSINPYLVDIRQVEVLRGPQGTLFGANSMGGTLRILTNRPDPSAFASFAEGTVAAIEHGGETYAVSGMVNVPVANESALRLVGYYEDSGGFIDNVGTGNRNVDAAETVGGRLAAAMPLGDRLSIDLSIVHQERLTDGLNIANISLPAYQQGTHIDESWQDDWTLYNAVLNYDLAFAELMSSTSFVDRYWRAVGDVSGFLDFFGVPTGAITADHSRICKNSRKKSG
jgi:iron complex outermembrane recepter protein